MKLLTAAQMREVDRRAIDDMGIPIVALMENAGRAVAEALEAAVPDVSERSLLIVCGTGNNGGDGLVAARHLASRGCSPQVLLLGRIGRLKSAVVREQALTVRKLGIPLIEVSDPRTLEGSEDFAVADFDVIVDAVFGTGFRPPAKGIEAIAIRAMAEAHDAGAFVVAVDLPSGLDADGGRIDGPAVAADLTVTFGAAKPAHFLAPADALVGELHIDGISLPRALIESPAHRIELVDSEYASLLLAPRREDAHKGTFGHLLLVAGSRGKTGAAILAARAALRAGVGLVTVATPASCAGIIAAGAPEIMVEGLPETADGTISGAAVAIIRELLKSRSALAIGPGLGTTAATAAAARTLVLETRLPAVVDADALNAFAGKAAAATIAKARGPRILTPHPGEAGRLLGRSAETVNADRLAAVRELALRSSAVVVLKGQHTLTASHDGALLINSTGNPGLATAGTGDVLTGIAGALLARDGASPLSAAALAVHVHGLSGDLAAAALSETALIATDVIEMLPRAWRLLEGDPEPEQEPDEE